MTHELRLVKPMAGKLAVTRNFLELYVYCTGTTEIPEVFHVWNALSVVAAALSDRVYVMKMKKRVVPNLYTLLVGASASGKGEAIDVGLRLMADVPALVNRTVRGQLTKQRLYDLLGGRMTGTTGTKKSVREVEIINKPYIIFPELYNSLGPAGRIAEDFIACLTDLYTGSPIPVREGTRGWGEVVIKDHTINWMAATTEDWLMKSIGMDAVLSGFFGRVLTITGTRKKERIYEPLYPEDYDEVIAFLKERLAALCEVSGEMTLSQEARDIGRQWYEERPDAPDEALEPSWLRDEMMVLKLATILSMCEGDTMVVSGRQMHKAQYLVGQARKSVPHLVQLAAATPDLKSKDLIKRAIRRAGHIEHSRLLKLMASRGIIGDVVNRMLLILVQEGFVRRGERGPRGGLSYYFNEVTRTVDMNDQG